MLKNKKALSLLLVLVMVFAFSANAFAIPQDQVEIKVYVEGLLYDTKYEDINTGDTVEDVVKSAYPDPVSTWSGSWMTSLLGYASEPYVSDPIYFDEDGFYEGGDLILDAITEYGGVMMDASDMLAPGYYFMGDWQHTLYLGSDWTFQIDYADDGIGNPVTPGIPMSGWWGDFYEYTMGEAELADGDIVYLNYDFAPTFF